jgi:hypothetical protein
MAIWQIKPMLDHGMPYLRGLDCVRILTLGAGNVVCNQQRLVSGILLTFNCVRFKVLIVMSLKVMVFWMYVV